MPESFEEKVNRVLRDHEGFTGDGRGGVGDLPTGDRSTSRKPIEKRDLRSLFLAADGAAKVALDAAEEAAASAAAASGTPQYATRAIAQAATVAASAVAIIVAGELYVKDASGNDLTTAGGVKWRKKESPLTILCLGQSNMRGNAGATGGTQTAPTDSYVWDNYIPAFGGGGMTLGTQWRAAEIGEYPANQAGSNVLPFAIMRSLRKRTGRPIYGLTVARGGHSIEAFLLPATLTTNGWTRPVNHVDLTTQLYPQAANALAAVPGSPSSFDAVYIHQGEYNMDTGDSVIDYRAKLAALYSDLLASGVVRPDTDFVFGGISNMNPRWIDHAGAITNQLHGPVDGLKFATSKRVRLSDDNIHFSGAGIDTMGARMVDAAYSPLDKNSISESGTFTPTVTDVSGNPATGTFTGVWRRDGRMVFASLDLLNVVTAGMNGPEDLRVYGVPWASAVDAFGEAYLSRVSFSGTPTAFCGTGIAFIRIALSPSDADAGFLKVNSISSGLSRIRVSVSYPTLS